MGTFIDAGNFVLLVAFVCFMIAAILTVLTLVIDKVWKPAKLFFLVSGILLLLSVSLCTIGAKL